MKITKVILLFGFCFLIQKLSSQAVYNGSDKHTFTTNFGTIDIGPFNSSYGHIYTDRPKIIFNKPVWTTANIFSSYNNDLVLQTEGNERIRINDDTGNVGIGTGNPQEKLEVKGRIYLNTGTDEDNIYWARHHMTMGTIPGSYNHNYFNLKPGGSSNGVLHSRLDMYVANSETSHENKVRIHTSGSSYFNGGNIGIGTTNPTSKLHVVGDFYLYGNEAYSSGWGKNHFYWRRHSLIMGTPVGAYAHNLIELKPGGSNTGALHSALEFYEALDQSNHEKRIRISSATSVSTFFNAGKVGIGTENPDSKLTVKGDIHAEEVKVDLSVPGPDYVFKDNYKLRSLEEVQNYIDKHGHLPNIPSAKEMEANGIELGEMNMKLLEKIEELVLYTLKQEEKIQDGKRLLAIERRTNKEQEERLSKLEQLLIQK